MSEQDMIEQDQLTGFLYEQDGIVYSKYNNKIHQFRGSKEQFTTSALRFLKAKATTLDQLKEQIKKTNKKHH